MNYCHRFQVHAPLSRVSDFHSKAASMPTITPPPLSVRLHHTPDVLGEGDDMDFSLGVGPFSIRWEARIERVSSTSFTDRQIHGPFAEWVHRHSFNALDNQATEVVDEITLRPRSHFLWWLVGMGMWAGLPFLFAFRASKTRRMLQ
jgi:ligand-binding SRPBCC domain-containing protein